jgi:dTDP-4-amino-4,6-dideoxygalactose transaminase
MTCTQVPFFRPDLSEREIKEVEAVLRSGWLTSGPYAQRFEREFAAAAGAPQALAVNSCTAALHLAVEALGLKAGQGVFVPALTFAATAEVVRYCGAYPVLVDCDPVTGNLDLADAEGKLKQLRRGELPDTLPSRMPVVGIIPVHVGGLMMNTEAVSRFAERHGLWVVEDAAHAFPAAWRPAPDAPWRRCGEGTADVTCYSFYANKTITTGEGGMAVTGNSLLAERMRLMTLHGLSRDAWGRYSGGGSWDYRIVAPGFKYNITDIAAAIGVGQLTRAEEMRRQREQIAKQYLAALAGVEELSLPPEDVNRVHSWHLFPVRLNLRRLKIDRNTFIEELKARGVGCSVHWRPLHLHPYYEETFGWRAEHLPVASRLWLRLISLPIFSAMREEELEYVTASVKDICARFGRRGYGGRRPLQRPDPERVAQVV